MHTTSTNNHIITKEELKDKIRKLLGIKPYDTMTNMCYGDGYFAESIKRACGSEELYLRLLNEVKEEDKNEQ